jgi:polyferredoxin
LTGMSTPACKAPSVLKTIFRPRTLIYSGIWGGIGLAMLFALGVRTHTDISVAKDRNPPFMLMSDGSVRNSYTLKLRNMESRPRTFEIAIDGLSGGKMWTGEVASSSATRSITRKVAADSTESVRAYIVVPAGTAAQEFAFTVRSKDGQGETDRAEARFDVPGGQ